MAHTAATILTAFSVFLALCGSLYVNAFAIQLRPASARKNRQRSRINR